MSSIFGYSYTKPDPFKKKVVPTSTIYQKSGLGSSTNGKTAWPYGQVTSVSSVPNKSQGIRIGDGLYAKPVNSDGSLEDFISYARPRSVTSSSPSVDPGKTSANVISSVPESQKQPPTTNPTNSYLTDMSNLSKESAQFLKDKHDQDQAFLETLYGKKNQALSNQAPYLQKNFDQLKADTEADIGDVTEKAKQAGVNAETNWGTDQRALAQTRRESEARNNAKYAMLNTTDSYGEGSYGRAQENVESDFNRQTATGLERLGDKKFQIGQELSGFIRQAKTYIINERTKLNAKLQEISDNMELNDTEKAQMQKQAYDEFQGGMLGVKQELANLKKQYAESSTSNLSEDFLKTGVPTTAAEFEFLQKNKDAFSAITSKTGNNQDKALTMVNNILSGNLGGISGAVRYGNVPFVGQWSGATTTQSDYDGLKSLLSLAERGQLKGSGQVSDFEAKMLEKAAMAGLNQNLPTDEFKRRLGILRNDLMSGGAIDNVPRTIRVKNLQTGETGTLPANEYDPSLYKLIQ